MSMMICNDYLQKYYDILFIANYYSSDENGSTQLNIVLSFIDICLGILMCYAWTFYLVIDLCD